MGAFDETLDRTGSADATLAALGFTGTLLSQDTVIGAKSRQELVYAAAGLITANIDIAATSNTGNPTSQKAYFNLVGLRKGEKITDVVIKATAIGTVTALYGGIYATGVSTAAQVAVSLDFSASATVGYNVIPLSSAYVVPATGAYYLAYLAVYTGTTTLTRGGGTASSAIGSGVLTNAEMASQNTLPGTATLAASSSEFWVGCA